MYSIDLNNPNGVNFTTLCQFPAINSTTHVNKGGAYPQMSLTLGTDGKFYGVTQSGGTYGLGTLFKITPASSTPWPETAIYSFNGYNHIDPSHSDGNSPLGSLLLGSDGNFYGTCPLGGELGHGTIFKYVTSTGMLTTLYSFTDNADGASPYAGLVQDSAGNFYGTTFAGGVGNQGSVFQFTNTGSLNPLYNFQSYQYPNSLIKGKDGNYYGTTLSEANGKGSIFQIQVDSQGNLAQLNTIHVFAADGSEGTFPEGLIQDKYSDNYLYGTTYQGGLYNGGTIFQLSPNGSFQTLYSFNSSIEGANPAASLALGNDGSFYGTTTLGGTYNEGTVFNFTPGGTPTTLAPFNPNNPDGSMPLAALVQGTDGAFYGTTYQGGKYGSGTIYKLSYDTINKIWNLTTLYSFPAVLANFSNSFGAYPTGSLVQGLPGSDGHFYGTTRYGGTYGNGVVFELNPPNYHTLYIFSAMHNGENTDGAQPWTALTPIDDASFYGTTSMGGLYHYGTIFKLTLLPVITELLPQPVNAGGPTFTMNVKGYNFPGGANVYWNGSLLPTTPGSDIYHLQATVDASFIANAGTAEVTVKGSYGHSKAVPYPIVLTTLALVRGATKITKNSDGSYTANITLKNKGYQTAPNVTIQSAYLNSVASSTSLPDDIGSIASGATKSASLVFPSSAGTSGQSVTLNFTYIFNNDDGSKTVPITLSQTVTLP